MNIICLVVSTIALLTVAETYAMNSDDAINSDDFGYGSRVVSKVSSPQDERAEKNEGYDDYWLYELNAYMLRSGKSYFHKFNDSSYAQCVISVAEKVLKDPSNTLEEIENIYIHRGAAWYQLGHYFEALKDFQVALSFKNPNGCSVIMQKVHAEVESHIGIISEEVGMYDEAASIYEVVLERKTRTGFALSSSDRSEIGSRLEKIREMKSRNASTTLPEPPYHPALEKMKIDNLLNSRDTEEEDSEEETSVERIRIINSTLKKRPFHD